MAIIRNGNAGGAGLNVSHAVDGDGSVVRHGKASAPATMAQLKLRSGEQRGRRRNPNCSVRRKNMNVVTLSVVGVGVALAVKGGISHAAGYVKRPAAWVEGNPAVGVGDHHILLIDRHAAGNVVDEHVFA